MNRISDVMNITVARFFLVHSGPIGSGKSNPGPESSGEGIMAKCGNLRIAVFSRTLAAALLAGALASGSAFAEDLSTQQIIDGLKVSKTRSLSLPDRPANNADDQAFINRVRGQSRSLSFDDRE